MSAFMSSASVLNEEKSARAERALLSGEHSTDASFMRGAVKIEGDHVVWLLELRDVREAAFAALAPITSL